MSQHQQRAGALRMAAIVLISTGLGIAIPAYAQPVPLPVITAVTLPVSVGWFGGEPSVYTATDASDQAIARSFHANYSPALGKAANGPAADAIYVFTTAQQGNILASHPHRAGPRSIDQNYTPIWQVSTVAWNPGQTPFVLTSEGAVLQAAKRGLVTVALTNVIVNCSVIYTPTGGLLPGATLITKPRN